MKSSELDKKFDAGENVTAYLDLTQARRPQREQQRVNVDFPKWLTDISD